MNVQNRARKRAFALIFILTFVIAFTLLTGSSVFGMEPFPIKNYVTDQAGLLSKDQQLQIAVQLDEYAKATSNQILVVIMQSLQGEDLVDFTEKLFELNKPGQKREDNGLILLIALNEKKIRIEVGYGLEGAVPDGKAGAIIDQQITPYFKAGNFYNGISAGVYTLIKSITPDYNLSNQTRTTSPRRTGRSASSLIVLIFIILFISSVFGSIFNSGKNIRNRHRRGFSEPWFWGGGFGGGSSGGGFFGGGNSGGGGGSDGGFSGGGGSFGGGGASGGW